MTRKEQIDFVEELTANIAGQIIKAIQNDKIPGEWDGHELRVLLADRFEDSARMSILRREWRSKRNRNYTKHILVTNI